MRTDVEEKLNSFPTQVRNALFSITSEIEKVAEKIGKNVDTSLKWGQPSFVVKGGTAVRLDWDAANPDYVIILFHCQTQLIETFREVMPEAFIYKGKRAIWLPINQPVPNEYLNTCIEVAFTYKSRKGLFLLGL
ncbi:DUF1801 domain-containing protein [Enterovibrio coralii]|uniref:YdhG-like domain-containing protein n=1 Tax=Enterovibrio coralii TaxID=294935 RepID=A0A135ICJ1_9GAMM|nr:DUF1801 domain-containing protein [Enterovibrio coralii]KXF83108.1 hypothetical protein ATN88_05175 [Enterovibrio coralii]